MSVIYWPYGHIVFLFMLKSWPVKHVDLVPWKTLYKYLLIIYVSFLSQIDGLVLTL